MITKIRPKYGPVLLLLASLNAPVSAEEGSLQDVASKVLAELQKARQANDADVPFVFGHYPAPEAVDTSAQASGPTEPVAQAAPAIVPPSWKGNGTVTMRGQIMVFVNGQSYKVGDTLEGYAFKDINANEITVTKAGHTFKRPAR